jgi:energy-coupling factor transporter transmembrane protein EcfT
LLMPLLVQSFLLSEELAMAMESRGFRSKGRSFRKEYRIAPWEFLFMILCLVSTIALAYWEKV